MASKRRPPRRGGKSQAPRPQAQPGGLLALLIAGATADPPQEEPKR